MLTFLYTYTDIDILIISTNGYKKFMKPIRITSRRPTRIRKRKQFKLK